MAYRLIIQPFIIAAIVAVFMLDHRLERPYGFALLAAAGATACIFELRRMLARAGRDFDVLAVTLSTLVTAGLVLFSGPGGVIRDSMHALLAGFIALLVFSGMAGVWDRDVERFASRFFRTLGAFAYLGLPAAMMLAIRVQPVRGEALLILLIAVAKVCDSAAYFTGRALGGRKLIPHVSPGKTVAGLIGGLTGGCAAGAVCWFALPALSARWSLAVALGASLFIAVVAVHSDLVESAIKRGTGVKDSSHLLPEIGGVLDIADSFLLAAPALYAVLLLEG